MPKTLNFTQEQINAFFNEPPMIDPYFRWYEDPLIFTNVPGYHCFYHRCCYHTNQLRVHADGLFPYILLKERRPNETEEIMLYRERIFVARTKPTFNKVFSSLQKIRRSPDWSITFKDLDQFTKIVEEENLENYLNKNFPYFKSITNWAFTLLLRKMLIDPNGVVMVTPDYDEEVEENEYVEPYPKVFDSEHVIHFVEEDYAVLNNTLGCWFWNDAGTQQVKGRSIYVVTTQDFWRYDQVNSQLDFELNTQYSYHHGLGILPVFKIKGNLIDQYDNNFYYESKIAGMLPELDEATREYSDLQAAKVLHIYPERWQYTNNECISCKGTGHTHNPNWFEGCNCEPLIECQRCKGHGYTNVGPYSVITIKPPSALSGQTTVPTPPAGFIEKDVTIVKLQEDSVERHIYNALDAINFAFLDETPVAQAGIAKAMDHDEANNMVHSVAEDLIACMDSTIKIIAYYRYLAQYSEDEIDNMLPDIPVPENYDVLYTQNAEKELTDAKAGKVNPVIINALEVEYASKKFNYDSDVRDRVALVLELDPLPNITEDEKVSRLANDGITQESYIISSNIQEFVNRAVQEDPEFADKPVQDQRATMLKYAEEQVAAISAKTKIVNMTGNGLNPANNPTGDTAPILPKTEPPLNDQAKSDAQQKPTPQPITNTRAVAEF